MLPAADVEFLAERGIDHHIVAEVPMLSLVLCSFVLPPGLNVAATDVLLRLSPGYPDVPPDMWWCDPAVRRADGSVIQATELQEIHEGRNWQRWSRHLAAGQWQSGTDCLESFVALIRSEFTIAAARQVA